MEHLGTGIGQVTLFGGITRQPQYFFSRNIRNKVITWLFCVTMKTRLSASIFRLRLLGPWSRVTF